MKSIPLLLTLILIQIGCPAQKNSLFIIEHLKLKDFDNKASLKTEKSSHFYEDEVYTADKTCMGEFGGYVTFTNKKTGMKYSYNSTCAVIINKLNEKYYITSTLAHMQGFASIQVVEDPELLNENTGVEVLVDSIGILTLGSFIFDNQLFHIITDQNNTYLSQISNGSFVVIDTLINESLSMYDPIMTKHANGDYVLKIQYLTNKSVIARNRIEGYIVVNKNKIQIIRK